jgi:hypothetical protein
MNTFFYRGFHRAISTKGEMTTENKSNVFDELIDEIAKEYDRTKIAAAWLRPRFYLHGSSNNSKGWNFYNKMPFVIGKLEGIQGVYVNADLELRREIKAWFEAKNNAILFGRDLLFLAEKRTCAVMFYTCQLTATRDALDVFLWTKFVLVDGKVADKATIETTKFQFKPGSHQENSKQPQTHLCNVLQKDWPTLVADWKKNEEDFPDAAPP